MLRKNNIGLLLKVSVLTQKLSKSRLLMYANHRFHTHNQ